MRLTSSAPCLAEHLLRLLVERGAALEQPEPAEDCRKQVVEIMGKSACKLADRVKALRLEQPVFKLAPLGYVEQRADDFLRVLHGIMRDDALVQEASVFAIRALPSEFAAVGAGRFGAKQSGLDVRQVVRMHTAQAKARLGRQPLGRKSGQPLDPAGDEAGIKRRFERSSMKANRNRLQYGFLALLRGTQGSLRLKP